MADAQLTLQVVMAQRRDREGTEPPTVATQTADRTGLVEWRTDTFEKFPEDQFRQKYRICATLFPVHEDVEVMHLLNQLRENEGASVTVTCPNPDFNNGPDQVIEVCDDWTGWQPQRFGGDTLLAACKAAMLAKTTPEPLRAAELLADASADPSREDRTGRISDLKGAVFLIDGVQVQFALDAHGIQLLVRGQEQPCAILDVFEDRVQLLAFDQEVDYPRVVIKFDEQGQIESVQRNPAGS